MPVLILVIGLFNLFFGGFIFMKLWNWFPHIILDVPSIGYAASLGLLLVISFFKKKDFKMDDPNNKDKNEERNLFTALAGTVFLFLAWGFGFIVQSFI